MSPTSRGGVPTGLLQAFYEGGNVSNVLFAEGCGKQLRHGQLWIFDESHRFGQAFLCRFAFEWWADTSAARLDWGAGRKLAPPSFSRAAAPAIAPPPAAAQ
jgi:hypothetical protein